MAESIGRRANVWFYRLELPPGTDGKRRQKRVGGFATERAAKLALAQARTDVARGKLRYAEARTVAELAAEWLDAVTPNRKASTAANYRMLTQAYIVPGLGSKR